MKSTPFAISPCQLRRFVRLTSLFLFCSPLLALSPAFAQDDSAAVSHVPPSGPLIATAPAFSQWVVTYSYPDERPPAPDSTTPAPKPKDIDTRTHIVTTTKTREIVHEQIADVKGKTADLWHVGDIQYRKPAGAPDWVQNQPEAHPGPDYSPLPATGFRDLDEVSRDTYVSTIKYGGKLCLVFASGAPPHADLTHFESQLKNLDAFHMVALIDAESRLPIMVEIDRVIRFYHFNDPPSEMQSLPPDLAQQLKESSDAIKSISGPCPTPY